jgi:hypothetical protein
VETGMPTTFCSCSTKSLSRVSKSFADLLQANRPALVAVFAYVPTSQVQLGGDYPFGTSTDGIRGLEEYGLKPSDLDAIYHGNAECLPRSKAHERI